MANNFAKDYVEVADRLAEFFKDHPEGSMQGEIVWMDEPKGWLYTARAYRSPDDPRPGVGHAFEPVPGTTPYTRNSEAMNAETSAWGRALVAVGLKTKHIASANEVRARQGNPPPAAPAKGEPAKGTTALTAAQAPSPPADDIPFGEPAPEPQSFKAPGDPITKAQFGKIGGLMKDLGEGLDEDGQNALVAELRAYTDAEFGKTSRKDLTKSEASQLIEWLIAKAA